MVRPDVRFNATSPPSGPKPDLRFVIPGVEAEPKPEPNHQDEPKNESEVIDLRESHQVQQAFAVLGLPAGSDWSAVAAAYRTRLAQITSNAELERHQVNTAYATLRLLGSA